MKKFLTVLVAFMAFVFTLCANTSKTMDKIQMNVQGTISCTIVPDSIIIPYSAYPIDGTDMHIRMPRTSYSKVNIEFINGVLFIKPTKKYLDGDTLNIKIYTHANSVKISAGPGFEIKNSDNYNVAYLPSKK